METVNHEYYVSPEIAELLKEAKFDWECWANYSPNGKFQQIISEWKLIIENWNNTPNAKNCLSCPSLDVAQRYLREIKNCHIEVLPDFKRNDYVFNVITPKNKFWVPSTLTYSTYEEAQEAGIKKALEIILEKGE